MPNFSAPEMFLSKAKYPIPEFMLPVTTLGMRDEEESPALAVLDFHGKVDGEDGTTVLGKTIAKEFGYDPKNKKGKTCLLLRDWEKSWQFAVWIDNSEIESAPNPTYVRISRSVILRYFDATASADTLKLVVKEEEEQKNPCYDPSGPIE